MEEHADLGRLPLPEKLRISGLVSLPILFRGSGPVELKRIPLFFRTELAPLYTDLARFLKSKTSFHFHLTGPPGAGKTSFVTQITRMWAARSTSRRVLFISYSSHKRSDIYIFDGAEGVLDSKRHQGKGFGRSREK